MQELEHLEYYELAEQELLNIKEKDENLYKEILEGIDKNTVLLVKSKLIDIYNFGFVNIQDNSVIGYRYNRKKTTVIKLPFTPQDSEFFKYFVDKPYKIKLLKQEQQTNNGEIGNLGNLTEPADIEVANGGEVFVKGEKVGELDKDIKPYNPDKIDNTQEILTRLINGVERKDLENLKKSRTIIANYDPNKYDVQMLLDFLDKEIEALEKELNEQKKLTPEQLSNRINGLEDKGNGIKEPQLFSL